MSATNIFTADQHIATLEQEIFALRNAKCVFDGVEILKPSCANKPTENPKVLEPLATKPSTKPKLAELAVMTQPPVHTFSNVKETPYQPPHECNFAAVLTKPAKDLAYHYITPIQNPQTAIDIYNESMKVPLVTLSLEDLFATSTEVRNRLHEAIMPR
jgi:hypothetical protein